MKRLSAFLAVLFLAGGTMAYAGIVVPYSDPENQGTQSYTGNLGLTFDVLSPITVVDLGVFNASGSGFITGSIQVAIYDTVANALVTPVITFTDASYTLGGLGFDVFMAITPVLLPVGSYEVDAVGFSATDPNGNLVTGSTGPILINDVGAISFTGAAYDPSPILNDPSGCFSCSTAPTPQDSQFDAGTFVIGAPEPSFFGLLAAGTAGLLFAARRRRAAGKRG